MKSRNSFLILIPLVCVQCSIDLNVPLPAFIPPFEIDIPTQLEDPISSFQVKEIVRLFKTDLEQALEMFCALNPCDMLGVDNIQDIQSLREFVDKVFAKKEGNPFLEKVYKDLSSGLRAYIVDNITRDIQYSLPSEIDDAVVEVDIDEFADRAIEVLDLDRGRSVDVVTFTPTPTRGTWILMFKTDEMTFQTDPLAYDVSAQALQKAVEALGVAEDIEVFGSFRSGFKIAYNAGDLSSFRVENHSLKMVSSDDDLSEEEEEEVDGPETPVSVSVAKGDIFLMDIFRGSPLTIKATAYFRDFIDLAGGEVSATDLKKLSSLYLMEWGMRSMGQYEHLTSDEAINDFLWDEENEEPDSVETDCTGSREPLQWVKSYSVRVMDGKYTPAERKFLYYDQYPDSYPEEITVYSVPDNEMNPWKPLVSGAGVTGDTEDVNVCGFTEARDVDDHGINLVPYILDPSHFGTTEAKDPHGRKDGFSVQISITGQGLIHRTSMVGKLTIWASGREKFNVRSAPYSSSLKRRKRTDGKLGFAYGERLPLKSTHSN